MKMNREEATLLGFEIVAYAGEARSYLLDALKAAENGDYDKAEALCEEANTSIKEAHKAQTSLLTMEASGDDIMYSCLLYTSPSPRDRQKSRMPSSA